ncbi:ArgP/LysG family DNA-binding transcriptional regulator, partial [Xanthomonas perforans]|nr:ArgP/LysG family DNA-binding transcriptional regulator [Xanthomonas perforans]
NWQYAAVRSNVLQQLNQALREAAATSLRGSR